MRFLFALLRKYAFVFVFLLLELISIIWIVRGHDYQKSVLYNASQGMVGDMLSVSHRISNYTNLTQENKQLLEENAMLRNTLSGLINVPPDEISDTLLSITNDSLYRQRFLYESADVIHHSIHHQNNYIMLNKGSVDGISSDMGIVGSKGVMGIVTKTSSHFSWGMSMLNTQMKLSAKLLNHHVGTVEWPGNDYRYGVLKDIPGHVDVNIGDTVVTSGYSHIFPKNIPIGVVSDISIAADINMYTLSIKFIEDYNQVNFGYIIKNLHSKQIDSLTQE